jgi:hypothetical protein
VVTFEDIQPFLFRFTSTNVKHQLVISLLRLLGVSVFSAHSSIETTPTTGYSYGELLDGRKMRQFMPRPKQHTTTPVACVAGVPVTPEIVSAIESVHQFPLHHYPQALPYVDATLVSDVVLGFTR